MYEIINQWEYDNYCTIRLMKDEETKKLYIPRRDVMKALGYTDVSQLSRMQARYHRLFDHSYVKTFSYLDDDNVVKTERGLYGIDGVVEVCSHTQRFRKASSFLDWLRDKLDEEKATETLPDKLHLQVAHCNLSEKELMIQAIVHLASLEDLIKQLIQKIP